MAQKSKIQWTDGRRFGRIKQFCKRNGIDYEEYMVNISNGLKWCTGCKDFHEINKFGIDNSRFDSLTSVCIDKRNYINRKSYKTKSRPKAGRRFVEARNDDRRQARRRVNYLVEQKLIPHPNNLPCADCNHIYHEGERRHEYDHYLGYDSVNHDKVESVCSICHKKRTNNGKRN